MWFSVRAAKGGLQAPVLRGPRVAVGPRSGRGAGARAGRLQATGRSTSRRAIHQPPAAPAHCAATKASTSPGRMPEKLEVSERASVTAGFANEVLAVNQYAAKM